MNKKQSATTKSTTVGELRKMLSGLRDTTTILLVLHENGHENFLNYDFEIHGHDKEDESGAVDLFIHDGTL